MSPQLALPGNFLDSYVQSLRHNLRIEAGTAEPTRLLLETTKSRRQLAQQGVYHVRADAVFNGDRTVLFVGEPGVGKSTICDRLVALDPALQKIMGQRGRGECEWGFLQVGTDVTIFPVCRTDANAERYDLGFPVTDLVYVLQGRYAAPTLTPTTHTAMPYSFLLHQSLFDYRYPKPGGITDRGRKCIEPHLRHHRLINPKGKLNETVALVQTLLQ